MLGDRIRELREHLLLKSKEFAELLRISPAHVSEIESNKNSPSEMLVLLICLLFRVSEKWLLRGEGEMFNQTEPLQVRESFAPYSDKSTQLVHILRAKINRAHLTDNEREELKQALTRVVDILTIGTQEKGKHPPEVLTEFIRLYHQAVFHPGGREERSSILKKGKG